MFYVRKEFLIRLIGIGLVNLGMIISSFALISVAINIVMPTGYYTADQFVTTFSLLCLGLILLANACIFKSLNR